MISATPNQSSSVHKRNFCLAYGTRMSCKSDDKTYGIVNLVIIRLFDLFIRFQLLSVVKSVRVVKNDRSYVLLLTFWLSTTKL